MESKEDMQLGKSQGGKVNNNGSHVQCQGSDRHEVTGKMNSREILKIWSTEVLETVRT